MRRRIRAAHARVGKGRGSGWSRLFRAHQGSAVESGGGIGRGGGGCHEEDERVYPGGRRPVTDASRCGIPRSTRRASKLRLRRELQTWLNGERREPSPPVMSSVGIVPAEASPCHGGSRGTPWPDFTLLSQARSTGNAGRPVKCLMAEGSLDWSHWCSYATGHRRDPCAHPTAYSGYQQGMDHHVM